ncbi:hypothetical protein H2200_009376 [Cladophialophora chaetospira]|uniref:Uncharacterized protein n=1 Tax=Cladophialophora chaetospira TaxID=386627 RepID=A0AA39CFN2_9EURO|nr:hypothetical protein H2200_009376 [Cladophialophora chaetospira]
MAPPPNENKLAENFGFVLRVLKHCEMPKPDWKAICTEEGLSRPDKPREKFKKILKDLGFDYQDDQIIDPNDAGAVGEVKEGATAKKVTTAGAKETHGAAETPNSKKRKSPTKKDAKVASAKKTKVDKSAGVADSGESKGDANGEEA